MLRYWKDQFPNIPDSSPTKSLEFRTAQPPSRVMIHGPIQTDHGSAQLDSNGQGHVRHHPQGNQEVILSDGSDTDYEFNDWEQDELLEAWKIEENKTETWWSILVNHTTAALPACGVHRRRGGERHDLVRDPGQFDVPAASHQAPRHAEEQVCRELRVLEDFAAEQVHRESLIWKVHLLRSKCTGNCWFGKFI